MNKYFRIIFSANNINCHKVITILGIKIKLRRNRCNFQPNNRAESERIIQSEIDKYNNGSRAIVKKNMKKLIPDVRLEWIREMIQNKTITEDDYTIFKYLSNPNTIFLDIGANCGYSAISLNSIDTNFKVVSFEVLPFYKTHLEEVKKYVNFDYQYFITGIYDKDKTIKFISPVVNNIIYTALTTANSQWPLSYNIWNQSYQSFTAYDNDNCKFNILEFKAKTTLLDKIIKNNPSCFDLPISVMKIDVEGLEYNVLKGAENTLKKYSPLIMTEGGNRNESVYNYLIFLGYLYAEKDQNSNKLNFVNEKTNALNGFWVHKSKIEEYKELGLLEN